MLPGYFVFVAGSLMQIPPVAGEAAWPAGVGVQPVGLVSNRAEKLPALMAGVITEEEGLVAAVVKLRNNDRATQSKSPLVVIQRRLFRRSCIEEIMRVKHRVF